jgi:hypothetical protein
MYLNTYVSIEIFIELFYNISSQVTCISLAYNPHRTLFVPWHYVIGTLAHALCCFCWVPQGLGQFYFMNAFTESNCDVTRYLAAYVRDMNNYFYVGVGSGYLTVFAGQRT